MAGIVGLYAFDPAWKMARFAYYSLLALQHRGQESCGIAAWNRGEIRRVVGRGLVDSVFPREEILLQLPGSAAIGSTLATPPEESNDLDYFQPSVNSSPPAVAVSLDGKIVNSDELISEFDLEKNLSDAQLIARLLSRELSAGREASEALKQVVERLEGAFCILALTDRGELLAARDHRGVKPLVVGSFGFDYGVVASESCALDVIGAEYKADVKPGEVYYFSPYAVQRFPVKKPKPAHCAFEYVYLARADSMINEVEVYEVRAKIGVKLANEHPVKNAEVVVGVPETAMPFAVAYANKARVPLELGFVQTGRRIRSAIKPTDFERVVGVQLKLNPIKSNFRGKRVVLVDDSVVRGTTTKNTVNIIRNRLGAKEVHVRVGSPKLVARCPYGVEVPPEDELIAVHLKPGEVSKVVGADSFHWLSLRGLVNSIGIPVKNLCLGCFTGKYPHEGKERPEEAERP